MLAFAQNSEKRSWLCWFRPPCKYLFRSQSAAEIKNKKQESAFLEAPASSPVDHEPADTNEEDATVTSAGSDGAH